MASSNNSTGGIGFLGVLQILFLGLKLTHYIDWNWLWVLSPTIFFFLIIALVIGIGMYIQKKNNSTLRNIMKNRK